MDGSGWIGLTWLVIGIGLLLFTIISQRHQPDPQQEDPEETSRGFPFKRLMIPLLLILAGVAMVLWGIGVFDAEPTDDRCCPGP